MELSSELALALNQEGYETINDELLIVCDNGRLVYDNNYWRAETSIVLGVLG
ncbi:hypothetical protein [Paenibacillus sp. AGC30]